MTALLRVAPGTSLDFLDKVIVVGGIVVGECELAHPRRAGEVHGVLVRAVAPVLLGRIFLGRVLRIVNHQSRVAHEARVAAVPFVRHGCVVVWRIAVMRQRLRKGLVVAQVHDARAIGLDAVAERHRRVMEVLREDPDAPHLVRSLAELLERYRRRKLRDVHGEVGELHLAGEHFAQRARASFRSADGDAIAGDEQRGEEGEALDVIPVGVTEQDRHRERTASARDELGTQRACAGPAVEDEVGTAGRRQLHAGGVAAEAVGPRAGRGNRPPRAPESYSHGSTYSYTT